MRHPNRVISESLDVMSEPSSPIPYDVCVVVGNLMSEIERLEEELEQELTR